MKDQGSSERKVNLSENGMVITEDSRTNDGVNSELVIHFRSLKEPGRVRKTRTTDFQGEKRWTMRLV